MALIRTVSSEEARKPVAEVCERMKKVARIVPRLLQMMSGSSRNRVQGLQGWTCERWAQ